MESIFKVENLGIQKNPSHFNQIFGNICLKNYFDGSFVLIVKHVYDCFYYIFLRLIDQNFF